MFHRQEEWNGLWFLIFASRWKNSWQRIRNETIVKSLKKCGISNALNGNEDDILYEESDASSENNQEDDFSGSDDDFLGFYDWINYIMVANFGM